MTGRAGRFWTCGGAVAAVRCQGSEICTAGPGSDAPTGLRAPTGTDASRPVP